MVVQLACWPLEMLVRMRLRVKADGRLRTDTKTDWSVSYCSVVVAVVAAVEATRQATMWRVNRMNLKTDLLRILHRRHLIK